MSITTVAAPSRARPRGLLRAAFGDLVADAEELGWLAGERYAALTRSRAEMGTAGRHLSPGTRRALDQDLRTARFRYRGLLDEVGAIRADAERGARSPSDGDVLVALTERRRAAAELVRTLAGVSSALLTATDWQSPSFGHAVRSSAGRHTGRVTEHLDDYKRDRHPDAREFERAWVASCVGAPPGLPLDALMTSCGMSAFAVVLAWLTMGRPPPRRVALGRSVYHECRDLLARSPLGPVCVDLDDARPSTLVAGLRQERPEVVFLDSMANAHGLAVPDLAAAIDALAGTRAVLVVDTTGLSVTRRPFSLLTPPSRDLTVLTFESLTKYAQFGLDRTAAGIVVAPRTVAEELDGFREHLGANVADLSAHLVPRPDRSMLERRLSRLGRNAELLASHLAGIGDRDGRIVTGACHPSLPDHPSHETARALPFRGGYLAVRFADRSDRPDVHGAFVAAMLREARRRGVPLAAGASFGLDTTRVYRTATTSRLGRPFVRIAAGTEHRLGVQALTEVLTAAVATIDAE